MNRNEQRLLYYMVGWRKGALGSAYSPAQWASADFREGHGDGRMAQMAAYAKASNRLNAVLSPLRGESEPLTAAFATKTKEAELQPLGQTPPVSSGSKSSLSREEEKEGA